MVFFKTPCMFPIFKNQSIVFLGCTCVKASGGVHPGSAEALGRHAVGGRQEGRDDGPGRRRGRERRGGRKGPVGADRAREEVQQLVPIGRLAHQPRGGRALHLGASRRTLLFFHGSIQISITN